MSERVSLFEVSLRDGLQNESTFIPTEQKLAHLSRLLGAGLRDIEVTSFVRPSRIPALADAEALVAALPQVPDARYWALVPNMRGFDRARACGVKHVCTFMSASETHNLKNVNRSVRESLHELREVIGTAVDEGVQVRAYLSTVFGCPYEGKVDPARVAELALELKSYGAHVVALGDTIGVGTPNQVRDIVGRLVQGGLDLADLALHTHDTRGTAIVNVYEAFQLGVRRFDGSVAGIGGCPYAPGASGNAATEDLLYLFEGLGVKTGVNADLLGAAGVAMEALLGRPLPGRVHRTFMARCETLSDTSCAVG